MTKQCDTCCHSHICSIRENIVRVLSVQESSLMPTPFNKGRYVFMSDILAVVARYCEYYEATKRNKE